MRNSGEFKTIVFGIVVLALGAFSSVVSAQERSGETTDAANDSQRDIRKFALNQEEAGPQTGLRWVDSQGTNETDSADDAADRDSRSEESARQRSDRDDNSEGSEEDAEFERLATSGRDDSVSAADQSLDLEDGGAEASGNSGKQFDVQFGSKNIGEIVDLYRKKLVSCYRNQGGSQSDRSGEVTLKLVVEKDGTLRSVGVEKSTLNDPATESCMVDMLRAIDYPPTESGQPTTWRIPFRFLD